MDGGQHGFWRDVRAGLVGEPRDFTRGPLGRAILVLAIPMVLELSMQSLFGVVDVYFVGRLGADAVAVVGMTDSLLTLVFAIALGISMASAAMVARRTGEGDAEGAARATAQSIALGLCVCVPVGLLGVGFAPELLRLMGASDELASFGLTYCAVILGGNVTIMLLFLINAAFRGAGEPVIAMRALWIANILNMLLDPLLIFGWGPIPAMGLLGAAVATTIGRAAGVVYQLYRLGSGRGRIALDRRHVTFDPGIVGRLLRVSGTGILQFLVGTASFLALVRIVAGFGADALAGYTIAIRVIIFVLLPAWGMGNAAATLVGQNLGAGHPERAEAAVWKTSRYNLVFLLAVGVAFVLFAETMVGVFSDRDAVVGVASRSLRIFSLSYPFWGFGMITVMAFNGAGDTWTPTWINFVVYWVLQIPLALALAHSAGLGPEGVFTAVAVCQAALAAVGVWMFRRGTWKHKTI